MGRAGLTSSVKALGTRLAESVLAATLRIYSHLPKRWPWTVDAQCACCGDLPGLQGNSETIASDSTALSDMGICNNGCRDAPQQRQQEAHMRRLAEQHHNLHPRARLQSFHCGCRPCSCECGPRWWPDVSTEDVRALWAGNQMPFHGGHCRNCIPPI